MKVGRGMSNQVLLLLLLAQLAYHCSGPLWSIHARLLSSATVTATSGQRWRHRGSDLRDTSCGSLAWYRCSSCCPCCGRDGNATKACRHGCHHCCRARGGPHCLPGCTPNLTRVERSRNGAGWGGANSRSASCHFWLMLQMRLLLQLLLGWLGQSTRGPWDGSLHARHSRHGQHHAVLWYHAGRQAHGAPGDADLHVWRWRPCWRRSRHRIPRRSRRCGSIWWARHRTAA